MAAGREIPPGLPAHNLDFCTRVLTFGLLLLAASLTPQTVWMLCSALAAVALLAAGVAVSLRFRKLPRETHRVGATGAMFYSVAATQPVSSFYLSAMRQFMRAFGHFSWQSYRPFWSVSFSLSACCFAGTSAANETEAAAAPLEPKAHQTGVACGARAAAERAQEATIRPKTSIASMFSTKASAVKCGIRRTAESGTTT